MASALMSALGSNIFKCKSTHYHSCILVQKINCLVTNNNDYPVACYFILNSYLNGWGEDPL